MNRRTIAFSAAALVCVLTRPAAAQDEAALRSFFEGKRVTLRIDMPGTSDGVDVRADSDRPIDYQRYADRLKSSGTAITAGDSATVTLIKVKKDLIEFQLGGGGFGTFSDDSSSYVYIPSVQKTSRERQLEQDIKDETDSRRRARLERELDELEADRARENRRIEAQRAEAEERKKERIARQRLTAGSRFNVRYAGSVPVGIKPAEVMAVLAEYVDFSASPLVDRSDVILQPSSDSLPRKGMMRADAERELGRPVEVSDTRQGTLNVTTLTFIRGDQRITADFVEDVMVRYAITSR